MRSSTPSPSRSGELPEKEFLVASFGLVSRAKRVDRALLGFRHFLRHWPDARFLIVGEVQESYPLEELDAARDLGERLVVTGRQPMDRFYLYMLASDVVVNLRFPSTGELSGTLIRTLGMGKPVLVSNTGPFAEFPEHTVARIDLGPPERHVGDARGDGRGEVGLLVGRGRLKLAASAGFRHLSQEVGVSRSLVR